ncbi:MAG: 5-formyltetrahydrofolate cyclo-ligase [Clostridia bacterium]|nr:5-formyltetrahydrofolate cyclo-ligase [Clostridia bacterium]
MDKKALRSQISAKKRAMTEEAIAAAGERLCAKFLACDAYKKAKSIYGYLSYNQEVRTEPILAQALKDGKRVAVPKVFDKTMMKFLWLDDLSAVAPGYFNIPEPIADGPEADDDTALVLMPGLAFDPEGHRLGYGGGVYDRYLEEHPDHPLIALCYGFQMFDKLETEKHDIPVDVVIADDLT